MIAYSDLQKQQDFTLRRRLRIEFVAIT